MATEAVTAFIDAMQSAGVVSVEPIADRLGPKRIYFRCECDTRKGRKTGWAKFYNDAHPAGSFGSYKLGIFQTWRYSGQQGLTPAERREIDQQVREAAAKREAEQLAEWLRAAEACQVDWARAATVNSAHGYLVRKNIQGEGLRQLGNKILVPMYDAAGKLWNLQRIGPDGSKLYSKGARANGLFLVLGDPQGRIAIAEGYGTASVVRRATGLPVAVSFTAGNLKPTAIAIREQYPGCEIIIAADDDRHLIDHPNIKKNVGLEAAQDAARAVGGRVAIPPRKGI